MSSCSMPGQVRRVFKDAGRVCPVDYRIPADAFAGEPADACDVLYVVGGLYGNPDVYKRQLQKYGRGIIGSSACIAGIIPKLLDNGQFEMCIRDSRSTGQRNRPLFVLLSWLMRFLSKLEPS